jgi:hypothetical protein
MAPGPAEGVNEDPEHPDGTRPPHRRTPRTKPISAPEGTPKSDFNLFYGKILYDEDPRRTDPASCRKFAKPCHEFAPSAFPPARPATPDGSPVRLDGRHPEQSQSRPSKAGINTILSILDISSCAAKSCWDSAPRVGESSRTLATEGRSCSRPQTLSAFRVAGTGPSTSWRPRARPTGASRPPPQPPDAGPGRASGLVCRSGRVNGATAEEPSAARRCPSLGGLSCPGAGFAGA